MLILINDSTLESTNCEKYDGTSENLEESHAPFFRIKSEPRMENDKWTKLWEGLCNVCYKDSNSKGKLTESEEPQGVGKHLQQNIR